MHKKFFSSRLAVLAGLLLLAACSKAPSSVTTGAHQAAAPGTPAANAPFVRLQTPLPTQSAGKIEVVEFFNYGCPHCNRLDPFLNQWEATLPADVTFRRIPLAIRQAWEPYARLYYAEQDLGLTGKLHSKIFHAIHAENIDLSDPAQLKGWLAKQGVDAARFLNVMNSFAVQTREQEGENLARMASINGVPTLVVDGRYETDTGMAGGPQQVPAVLNDLIKRARQDHTGGH
jgi:protein dithiol oxidoreductase (disulfide-forming)